MGYGKSAMVFHMLRRLVGEENFFNSLRDFVRQHSFRAASWNDLRKSFEKRTNQDLTWFFNQWLNNRGQPEIKVEDVKMAPAGKQFRVAVTLSQRGPLSRLLVPVTFYRDQVPHHFTVTLRKRVETFPFLLDSRPQELVVDENFEVFRKLSPAEVPPTFKGLLAAGPKLIISAPSRGDISADITRAFKERGVALKVARGEAGSEQTSSVLLLGKENPLVSSFFGNLKINDSGFHAVIRKHPHAPGGLVAVFQASGRAEVETALREMFNRQFYSDYVFQSGKLVSRTLQEAERGLRIRLAAPEARTN